LSIFSQFRNQIKPFNFSWILPNRLGIGPAPRTEGHWKALEQAGFHSCFSCCYLEEEQDLPSPDYEIVHGRVSFPDHRHQELLLKSTLQEAINVSRGLMDQYPPLYLHCWAGQERAALLAIAHVGLIKGVSVVNAIEAVREVHPEANPLYEHLELLAEIIK